MGWERGIGDRDYIDVAGLEGDYVEPGGGRGARAELVGRHLVGTNRTGQMKMWLYDSGQGMPETTVADGAYAVSYAEEGWGKEGGGPGLRGTDRPARAAARPCLPDAATRLAGQLSPEPAGSCAA